MAFLCLASASPVKIEKPKDERLFVSNTAGSFLALNSTLLITGVVILVMLSILGLFIFGGAGALPFGGNQRYDQVHEQEFYSDNSDFQSRHKRFATNGNVKFWILYYSVH